MSTIHLKIKIKTLAVEMQFIRREENKKLGSARWLKAHDLRTGSENEYSAFWSLRHHREGLGPVARTSQLAYAFLRGVPYRTVEPRVRCKGSPYYAGNRKDYFYPDWDEVFKEAAKFSGIELRILQQRFAQWQDEARLDEPGKTPDPIIRKPVTWDGKPGKSRRGAVMKPTAA